MKQNFLRPLDKHMYIYYIDSAINQQAPSRPRKSGGKINNKEDATMKTLQEQIAEQLNERKTPFLYVNMDYVLQDGTLQTGRDFVNPGKLFKFVEEDQEYYVRRGNQIVRVLLNFMDERNLGSSY